MILGNVLQAVNRSNGSRLDQGGKIMKNEIMETTTRKPRIAKKYRLPIIAILIIFAIVGTVAGVTIFASTFTYNPPTTAQVTGQAGSLDFGTLSRVASSS